MPIHGVDEGVWAIVKSPTDFRLLLLLLLLTLLLSMMLLGTLMSLGIKPRIYGARVMIRPPCGLALLVGVQAWTPLIAGARVWARAPGVGWAGFHASWSIGFVLDLI